MKKNIINKRKKKFLNFNFSFIIIFLLSISLFFYIYFSSKKILNVYFQIVEKYSNQYDYNLTNIEISNLDYLNDYDILAHFNSYIGKSIFLIPINDIAEIIKKNSWIKTLSIKSNYKNSLQVNIEEEIPFGIYDNNQNKILFSKNLIILEFLKDENDYSNLITFYGDNSINNSKKLIANFDNDFISMIESANFIMNRRWDLLMKNLILLKLPENNIKDSVNSYNKIYTNLSNQDLNDIKSIDLRIKGQATIKYRTLLND